MFDIEKYYEIQNEKSADVYEETYDTIKSIIDETNNSTDKYDIFFNHTGTFIIKLMDVEKKISDDYFYRKTVDELLKENNELYGEVLPQNYFKSYVNPKYCVEVFGDKFGQAMSYFYCKYRNYIKYGFQHKRFKIAQGNELFIGVYHYTKKHDVGNMDFDSLRSVIISSDRKDQTKNFVIDIKENYDRNFKFYNEIVENSDLNDIRYLFKYGEYITENEIRMAKFLQDYSEEKLELLGKSIVDAYIRSFAVEDKEIPSNATVVLPYICIGQEKIAKKIFKYLKKASLEPVVKEAYSIQDTFPIPANTQYLYDHRFDQAIYLDKDNVKSYISQYDKALEECKDILKGYSGSIYLLKFGAEPFVPNTNNKRLEFDEEQLKAYNLFRGKKFSLINNYIPHTETSFTVVSFPTPEIGGDFEGIFRDVIELNMLDNDLYEGIQQTIIDTLDLAEYVHIKGMGKNRTDIKIKMQTINNPQRETNFGNYLGDKNIPLGEVYTSPKLKDTNGKIHLEEIYINGIKYIDLELIFKDGYVSSYTCSNFTNENESENKKYIKDNLLMKHETLPMGEFAIGTNTLAYTVGKKHDIMKKLPNLISEKMGPHFAIGDTCFSQVEDKAIYNRLDGKEMIARDNEMSILRKTDVDKAYTNIHTDISLPYDLIDSIAVITKEREEINIIKGGRFVLEGTEILNKNIDLV